MHPIFCVPPGDPSFQHDFHRVFHSLFPAKVNIDHTAFPPEDWAPVAFWGLFSCETSTGVCRRPMARCCSLYGRARNSSSTSSSSGVISWVSSFFVPWGSRPVSRNSIEQPRYSQIGAIYLAGGSVFRCFQPVVMFVPMPRTRHKPAAFKPFSSNVENKRSQIVILHPQKIRKKLA